MAMAMTADELQAVFDNDPELQAQIAAQMHEYGHYVANQRIYAGNALAYAPGHQVPISNVVKHGYLLNRQVDLVEGKEHPPEVAATLPAVADAAPQSIPTPPVAVDDEFEGAE